MPGLRGPEVVQRIRSKRPQSPPYVLLLTSRDSSADIVQGLRGGADDYVTKPANEDELIARVSVGARVVQLQTALADRVPTARPRAGRAISPVRRSLTRSGWNLVRSK